MALFVLACLAYKVAEFQALDAGLLETLNSLHDTTAGSAAEVVRAIVNPLPFVLLLSLACGVGLLRKDSRSSIAALAVAVGANATTQILKVAFAHPRFQPVLGLDQLGPGAFPSGHMTAATSLVLAFAFVLPTRARSLTIGAGAVFLTAVGLSLVVVHAHYPSDVAGGFLVACGWGFATVAARDLREQKGPRYSVLPSSPLS